jgi:hypothetical protein
MTAVLVPVSDRLRVGSVRVLRRRAAPVMAEAPAATGAALEVLSFIEVRLDLAEVVEAVCDVRPDGERVPVLLTMLKLEDLALEDLSLANARACACLTTSELLAGWRVLHPRMWHARLVSFGVGDLRDVPRLVSVGWPDYTSDPSRAMRGEPEAISREDTAWYGSYSWQQHAARKAKLSNGLAKHSASDLLTATQRRSVVSTD